MLPGDFATLANLFFGAGNPLALLFDSSSCNGDNSEESQDMHANNFAFDNLINPLEGLRLPRSCMTYAHNGDMLPVHHEILRRIAIISRLQHILFD